jgi:hypothetical protein
MDMMVKLALAVLVAFGVRELVCRLSWGRQALIAAGLGVLILFEYLTFVPYPTAEVVPSPFLEALAGDGGSYGVLHLTSHEYAMYLQTLHGHPMVEGHIHRWPPGGSEWALQLHGLALYPPHQERPYWDILDGRLPYGRESGDIFSAELDVDPADILSRLNIRYVVFDRKFSWATDDKKLYRSRLREYFGEPIYEDKRVNVYEVHQRETAVPALIPGKGWYPLEGSEWELWRWMQDTAVVKLEGVPDGLYRLKLSVRPASAPEDLRVAVGEHELGDYALHGPREIITPPFLVEDDATNLRFSLAEPQTYVSPWRKGVTGPTAHFGAIGTGGVWEPLSAK